MIKHKPWVDHVCRVRGEANSRHGLIRLDKNERVTAFPQDFLKQILADVTSDHLTAYPETEQLYERLSRHHQLDIGNLMLTAGSDAGIRHCFDLFVNPGGDVVVLDPTFAMVDIYCQLYGANKQAIRYDSQLQLDLERLLAVIGPQTDMVVIANPNSPTGTVISEEYLSKVLFRAAEFQIPVLIDEAYYGFCRQTAVPLLTRHDNLIISRTFSKAYGLAGLRIGYLLAQVETAQLLYRFRPMYEVNSISVVVAMRLLEQQDIIDSYLAEIELGRKYLLDFLRGNGIDYRDTQTNFIHVDFGDRKMAALNEFARSGILVRGGLDIKGYENFLRVSLGPVTSMQNFVVAMCRGGVIS